MVISSSPQFSLESLLPFLVSALIFLLTSLKILHKFKNPSKQYQNLPPSLAKLPIIGNLHQLGKMPHLSLARITEKLGPIIFLQLGEIPTVFVSSPETAREVMKTHDLAFCSRPQLFSAKWLFYNCTNVVFSPYGSYWRHVRKICILELLSMKRVQSYDFVREEELARLCYRVKEAWNRSTVNLTKLLGLYANDVLCRVVLGRNFSQGGEYDKHGFQSMLNEYQALLGGFSVGDFFPSKEFVHTLTGHKRRLKKTFRRFDSFFDEVIKEHLDPNREEKGTKDLLDVLLDVQRDETGEISLTMDNVKAILLDMFAAGTDTTFITLDWAMTELIMNPSIMKRAQEEIKSTLRERKVVVENDLPQLHYLKSIVKETFRLHPPVPVLVPRESIEPVTLNGYEIPAKTRVFINAWAIGRDPRSWPEPEKFDPSRFIGSNIDFKGQDFELIPFGAGRRGCPGIAFGALTVELALAQLIHGFDWELPPGVQAKDLDLSEAFGISMHKISDLIVVAKPRHV